ncbi:MAG: hypothetical protein ACLTMP_14915 [Eggerthella lenta]
MNDTFGHPGRRRACRTWRGRLKRRWRRTTPSLRVSAATSSSRICARRSRSGAAGCSAGERAKMEGRALVALSVGGALAGIDGGTYESPFDAADRALYEAKRKGKDRVSFQAKRVLERGGTSGVV